MGFPQNQPTAQVRAVPLFLGDEKANRVHYLQVALRGGMRFCCGEQVPPIGGFAQLPGCERFSNDRNIPGDSLGTEMPGNRRRPASIPRKVADPPS